MSVQDTIQSMAIRYGVPPDLALRVAQTESNFRQDARGRAGEVGIFQLMPGTAADLGVNPYDANDNIAGGIRYLRQMFDRFGTWDMALAVYNAGPGNVSRGIIPDSTRGYIDKILGDVIDLISGDDNEVPTYSTTVYGQAPDSLMWLLAIVAGAGLFLLSKRR